MKNYFIAGKRLLAFNAKCGTSALVREIVRTYYPETEAIIQGASYPDGKNADTTQHHQWLPGRMNPDRPVVQVVRDPVERFRSAMFQVGLSDATAVLDELRDERGNVGKGSHGVTLSENIHFLPQSRFTGDITFFPLRRIEDAAAALGLRTPLLRLNESQRKPELTADQVDRVRAWYAADVELWDRVK